MRTMVKCAKVVLLACLAVFAAAQTAPGQRQSGTTAAAGAQSTSATAPMSAGQRSAIVSAYGRLPLSFEPNRGQAAAAANFLARGQGYALYLNSNSTTLKLHHAPLSSRRDRMEPGAQLSGEPPVTLRLRLVGGNAAAPAAAEEALPGKSNYFIGNDHSKWRTDVPNYGRVRYRGVYPGIDVVYYGNQRLLEHDFEVAPGADPRKIRLAFDGARSVEIAPSGDLVLHVADGEVRLHKPVIYQRTSAGKREIAGGFVLRKKNEVGIRVGKYDRRQTLIIDPTLSYSSYLGGSGEEFAVAVTLDLSGNVYVVGLTASTDFLSPATVGVGGATSGCAFGSTGCGGQFDDVFIVKMNPGNSIGGTNITAGSVLVYSTYLGGNGDDEGYSISTDRSGNAYVTGFTQSSNFPLSTSPTPFQSTLGSNQGNAFVSVIGPAGNTLLYSTYLGGHARDWGDSITQDTGGNIYVVGHAYSRDFPTLPATPISAPPPTVYASGNSGGAWTAGAGIISLQVHAIAVDRNTPGTVYVGQVGSGVYKSTDLGANWTATAFNQGFSNALVLDPTTTGASAVLYEGDRFGGVNRITGGGTGNTPINSGLTPRDILSLVLDPSNNAKLYAGSSGSGVWFTGTATAGTPSWSQLPTSGLGNLNINALALDPTTNTLYAGTDNGVYQLAGASGGSSWTTTSGGPAGLPVLGLAIDSASNVYAASFGGGLFKLSGGAWTAVNGSGGTALGTLHLRAVAVDPTAPSVLYTGGRVGMYRSADGGTTWAAINSGLTPPTGVNSVQSIAVDPATTSNVYAGMVNVMTFVAKFNSSDSPTVLALFGGASGTTVPFSVVVDDATSQNMFIGGWTNSPNMPGPLVGQTTIGGGLDGYIAEIATISTPAVVFDRYLGGAFDDAIFSLALDSNIGNIYVAGYTTSADFPVTAGAYQSALNGPPNNNADAFLSVIDPTGASLLYSTYFGGSDWDEALGVGVVSVSSVQSVSLVSPGFGGSGYTSPTISFVNGGGWGATATATVSGGVITAINVTNPGAGYTFIPGVLISDPTGFGATAQANPAACPTPTPLGCVFVSVGGDSQSIDLPLSNPYQASNKGLYDTFYARFDPNQSGTAGLLYSTYLGGSGYEFVSGFALDEFGAPWIVGQTFSTDFPTSGSNAVQAASSATVTTSGDAFAYHLQTTGNTSDIAISSLTSTAGATPYEGQTYSYGISVIDNSFSGANVTGAPGVVMSGSVPNNLTVTSVSTSQGSCSGLQTFTCNLGTVALGTGGTGLCGTSSNWTACVTVNVTANSLTTPPAGPTLAVTAQVSTTDDDPVPANNSASASVTVQRQADLTFNPITAPDPVLNGTPFSYSIPVVNGGPNNATNIVLSYPVPAGVTFNQGSSSPGCALAGGTVTCPVSNLAAFNSATIVINVTPSVAGTLTSSFTVSSSAVVDPNGANNTASFSNTINTNIDLSLFAPGVVSAPVGGSAAVAFTIRNLSFTDTATFPSMQVNLNPNFPAPGLSYIGFSSATSGVSCNQDGSVSPVFCSLPDLGPRTSVTLTLFVSSMLQGVYNAASTLTFSGTDTNLTNNSANTVVTVTGAVGTNLTTLLTDFERSTVSAYTGPGSPVPVTGAYPILAGASPSNIVIAPNGRLAFAANVNGSYISVIDLTIQAEVTRIRDVSPWSLALTADGHKLVSVGFRKDELDLIDLATFTVTPIILDNKFGDVQGVADIHPFSVALAGNIAYIANEFGPVIWVDITNPSNNGTVANTAALFELHAGHQVAVTPDLSTVAVFGLPTAGGNAVVYLIPTSGTNKNIATTVSTGFATAHSIAIPPNPNATAGIFAYLARSGAISALDLRAGSGTYGQIVGSVALPGSASGLQDMAFTPDGNTLQAIRGPFQGASATPSTLYTLNPALIITSSPSAFLSTVTIPGSISMRGLTIGYVQTSPSSGAPVVSDVQPAEITNEAAKTVTILGDNFASGAMVRIGNLDPLPSSFVSSKEITVTVPAGSAVQNGNIVVTLPNTAAGPLAAQVSGGGALSDASLRIDPPPTFTPAHPVAVSTYSTASLSLLFRDSVLLPAGPFSPPLAISPDGLFAYTGETDFDATNLDTAQLVSTTQGPNSAFLQCGNGNDGYAVAPDPLNSGKQVLYAVSCDGTSFASDTLYVFDVDPASTTTRNTLLRTLQAAPANFSFSQGLAATPDGRFVYAADGNTSGGTRLVIFDVLNSTSTVISDITALGADLTQIHMQVTPDGASLLLSGTGNNSIKVYDISGTVVGGSSPTNPLLAATITGSGAATTPQFFWFQVVGTSSPRLFAYDSAQRYVQAFDFNSRTALGSFTIPSALGTFAQAPMRVTPEGTLIYAAVENEDAVAVLDANLVASSSPNALITKMRTSVNSANIVVSPRSNASADLTAFLGSDSSSSTGAAAGVNKPFNLYVEVDNHGPSRATGVTMSLPIPAGVQVNFAIVSDAFSADNFSCTVTATLVQCPVGNMDAGGLAVAAVNVTGSTAATTTFTNTVAGNELDPNSANNTASLNVQIGGGADVGITVSASANSVPVGSPVTLTAIVTNSGPNTATAVTASLFFPYSSPPVFTTSQGTCTTFGTCSLGNLAAGASATISATPTFPSNLTYSPVDVVGYASSSTTPDPDLSNNYFDLRLPLTNPAAGVTRLVIPNAGFGQLQVYDPTTISTLGIPAAQVGISPGAMALSPNHRLAFVANFNGDYLSVADLSIQKEIYRIRGILASNIGITADGTRLVAPLQRGDSVAIIDASTFQVLQTVNLNGLVGDSPTNTSDITFGGMVMVGSKAYIDLLAGAGTNPVVVIDAASAPSATPVLVTGVLNQSQGFGGASSLAATPDGQYVLAVRYGSACFNTSDCPVQLISTASNSVVGQISGALNSGTSAVTATSSGFAYLHSDNDQGLYTIDLRSGSGTFAQVLPINPAFLPFPPVYLTASADGSRIYASTNEAPPPNFAVVNAGLLQSSPATAVIFTAKLGITRLRAALSAVVDVLPEAGAPQISDVQPALFFNDAPTTVTISGSGFAANSLVKLGKLDPLPVTFVSSSQVQVTVPAGAAAQSGPVIVMNPNSAGPVSQQWLSGVMNNNSSGVTDQAFEIVAPITFQSKFEAFTSNAGDGSITRVGHNFAPFVTPWPTGIAFTPDGSELYTNSLYLSQPFAIRPDGSNGTAISLPLGGLGAETAFGQSEAIAVANLPVTGQPVAYVASSTFDRFTRMHGEQLNVIDANPFSPSFNTVIDSMSTGDVAGGLFNKGGLAVAATANGNYVYENAFVSATAGAVVVFNTAGGTSAVVPAATLGVSDFQPKIVVTADAHWLLLQDLSGTVKVFDISGTPLAPAAIATAVVPFTPAGKTTPQFGSFTVAGSHLYAYDGTQNLLEVFNFNPAGGNLSFVNFFVVPGNTYSGYTGIAVTPDESLIAVARPNDDAVAVLDAAKVIAGDPTALITRYGTGIGPQVVAVGPVRRDLTPEDVGITITHSPNPVQLGSNVTYNVTLTEYGPFTGGGNGDRGGFLLNFDPSLVPVTSSLASSALLDCFVSGSQLNCAFTGGGPGFTQLPFALSGTVTFQATAVGTVTVKGYVAGRNYDPNTANNVATDTVTVVAADLGVGMTASPTTLAPSTNLTYTITVTNNGPSNSTGFTLTDTLPAGVTFVRAGSSSGCTASAGTVTCAGPALPVNQSATFILVVTPTVQATLTNAVSVTGNEADPVLANNTASVQSFAVAADIAVAAGAPTTVGGLPAYPVTVTNNGPSDATSVVFTDLLDNYGFVSATTTQGSCSFASSTLTCNLGSLANGASAVVTVVVSAPTQGWASNTFHATAAQPDPNPANNAVRIGPSIDSFNTPVGTGVSVSAADSADGLMASVTFSNVTRTGSTTMSSVSAASLPPGFRNGRQPAIFDLSTNAEFTGAIGLSIRFAPSNFRHPALVRLFHYEAGAWVDRTTALNATSGAIAASVLSLSPFALLEPLDTIPVANAGADRTLPGSTAGGARVTLDGSSSMDVDGDPLTYRWSGPFPEGGGVVTGVNPAVTLPLGVSKVLLVVNDGEADSPAAAVNIAVADFQLSAPAGSVALSRGQSASFTITSTPLYGAFAAPVDLACASGSPAVTCSLSASSITPGASGATATLTVTAVSTAARVPDYATPRLFALWLGTLPLFGMVFIAGGRSRRRRMSVLLLLLLVLIAVHVGCGGGGMTQSQSSSVTTRAVTVTVTGTSGTLAHSSTVIVSVPQ